MGSLLELKGAPLEFWAPLSNFAAFWDFCGLVKRFQRLLESSRSLPALQM
jgi:hypothetical protein